MNDLLAMGGAFSYAMIGLFCEVMLQGMCAYMHIFTEELVNLLRCHIYVSMTGVHTLLEFSHNQSIALYRLPSF